jgi:hypothetical protein
VNYEQNILQVLGDIQSEKGYYFLTRQDVNRDVRTKRAFVEDIAKDIPAGFMVEKWEAANLSAIYNKIEYARSHNRLIEKAISEKENYNNKIRGFQAQKEIEITTIDREIAYERSTLETEIAKLEALIKTKRDTLETLEQKRANQLELSEQRYKASVAKFDGEMAGYEQYLSIDMINVQPLVDEATEMERMKAFINEYRRMAELQAELEKLHERAEYFTRQIEKARTLPGEILKTAHIPIEGLTVVEGIPHINGLPISNLSEGEKLDLCIDVTLQKPGNLQIVLIDGVEKLSTANRERLYDKCRANGLQFIATRTDDSDELTITYLS